MSAAKVALGRHLFYDGRLSRDGTVACASCHLQARAFTDGRDVAVEIGGEAGTKNAPGLANTGYFPVLTWANPHMTSLEFQALVPLFGETPEEILACDLRLEMEGLPALREAIQHCETIRDYVSRELLADILADEEEHVD